MKICWLSKRKNNEEFNKLNISEYNNVHILKTAEFYSWLADDSLKNRN